MNLGKLNVCSGERLAGQVVDSCFKGLENENGNGCKWVRKYAILGVIRLGKSMT